MIPNNIEMIKQSFFEKRKDSDEKNPGRPLKAILLGSGGLDSSAASKFLQEHGVEVIVMCGNIGQYDVPDFKEVAEWFTKYCGAKKVVCPDLREEIAQLGILVAMTNAKYEFDYYNTTGVNRVVLSTAAVQLLKEENADLIVHGATGKGNDQWRFFQNSLVAAGKDSSNIIIYAPWRDDLFFEEWGKSRIELNKNGKKRGIPFGDIAEEIRYSTDACLLGCSNEAQDLEYLTNSSTLINPKMGIWPWDVKDPDVEDKKYYLTCVFDKGIPIKLIYSSNGKDTLIESATDIVDIFKLLNKSGGKQGIGIGVHQIERRKNNMLSRGVYEQPGIEVLGTMYKYLVQSVLDSSGLKAWKNVGNILSNKLYLAEWNDQEGICALNNLNVLAELFTGTVTVWIYHGQVGFEKLENVKYQLYDDGIASMDEGELFDHRSSQGAMDTQSPTIQKYATTQSELLIKKVIH